MDNHDQACSESYGIYLLVCHLTFCFQSHVHIFMVCMSSPFTFHVVGGVIAVPHRDHQGSSQTDYYSRILLFMNNIVPGVNSYV